MCSELFGAKLKDRFTVPLLRCRKNLRKFRPFISQQRDMIGSGLKAIGLSFHGWKAP